MKMMIVALMVGAAIPALFDGRWDNTLLLIFAQFSAIVPLWFGGYLREPD